MTTTQLFSSYTSSSSTAEVLPHDINLVVHHILDEMVDQEELRSLLVAELSVMPRKRGLLDYEGQEKLRIRTKNEILWLRIGEQVDACIAFGARNTVQGGMDLLKSMVTKVVVDKLWSDDNQDKAKKYASKALVVLEAFPIIMHMWKKATCWSDILISFVAAYKMLTGNSVIMLSLDLEVWLMHLLKLSTGFGPEWSKTHSSVQAGGTEEESEDDSFSQFHWIVEGARKLVDGAKDVTKCASVQKLKTLCCYFFSFGLCDKFNIPYKHLNLEVISDKSKKMAFTSLPDFIITVVDTVVWFAERAIQAVHMKSFSPFLHNARNYEQWVTRFFTVKQQAKVVSLPAEATKIDLSQFAHELHSVVVDGEQMVKWATKDEKKNLALFLNEAKTIEAEYLTTVMARAPRRAPLCIMVEGDSSVGKSSVIDLLGIHHAKYKGLSLSPECFWTRTPTDAFYSGVTSQVHTIIIDDCAFLKPTTGQLDPSIADIIQLCNNVSFCPPMASLEEKGRCPLHPQLVLGSTNTVELNATAYFKCPLAMRRRFPFVVHVEPKEKYKDSNGFLNGKVVPSCQVGEFPDLWDFSIHRVISVPSQKTGTVFSGYGSPQLEKIFDFVDDEEGSSLAKLLQWMNAATDNHTRIQDKVMVSNKMMYNVDYCACGMPMSLCRCEKEQEVDAIQAGRQTVTAATDKQRELAKEFYECATTQAEIARVMFTTTHSQGINAGEAAEILSWRDALDEDNIETERYVDSLYDVSDDDIKLSIGQKMRIQAECMVDNTVFWAHVTGRLAQVGFNTVVSTSSEFYQTCMGKLGCVLTKYTLLYCKKRAIAEFKRIGKVVSATWTKVSEKCCNLLAVLEVLSFGAGFLIGYKVVSSLLKGCSSVQAEPGTRPSNFTKDDESNPWQKEEFRLSSFHVGPKTVGWSMLDHANVLKRVYDNVVKVQFDYNNTSGSLDHTNGVALCVGGHVWITGNHVIPPTVTGCNMIVENAPGQINRNTYFALDEKDLYRMPAKDLVFFWTATRPPLAHLKDLFMESECQGMCLTGTLLTRDLSGVMKPLPLVDVCKRTLYCPAPFEKDWALWSGDQVAGLTQAGDCGSPLLCQTGRGPVILGLHMLLAASRYSGSVPLFRPEILEGMSHFGSQVQDGKMEVVEEYGPLHEKSVFRWASEGTAEVFGSAVGSAFRAAPKSKVQPTFISEQAQAQGFVKRCAPPALKGKGPWEKGIMDTLTMKYKLPRHLVEECTDAYVADILAAIPKEQLSELIILDDKTAMNGFPGVKFIDKINRNTSMGYPYRKSKQLYLVDTDGEDIWSDPKMYTPEVMARAHAAEDCYLRGERAMAVFIAALKDEPTPLEKVAIEKTRIFQMMNAEVALVIRKYLLTFIRLFQKNPLVFEGAPGLNCSSEMWGTLRTHLTQHGLDRLIAGDYGKYDKRMEPVMILFAFHAITRVLAAAGWSEKHLLAVAAMGEDIAYAIVYFQGDLLMLIGSNPSGQPLTVIINCIVNSLYMRLCFQMLGQGKADVKDFKKHVSLITYGDDNAMGSGVDWFNHTAISNTLAKFGIVYTMADKHTASIPFINIDEVSFLKRKWVWSKDTNMWMCPLDWSSLDKMLTMCVRSDSICPQAQSAAAMDSAASEFFQYGRQVYDVNMEKMKTIVKECHLQPFIRKGVFSTYDERVENYTSNTHKDLQSSLPTFRGESILQAACDLAPIGKKEYCCAVIPSALH